MFFTLYRQSEKASVVFDFRTSFDAAFRLIQASWVK
jgi:hypothetical protein